MVNPLYMTDSRMRKGRKSLDSRSGGPQMEVCLDEYGLLRCGQVIWLEIYNVFHETYIMGLSL